jgi:hypothetical protein
MSWSYRVVEYTDGSGFGLHEVYYTAQGHPTQMTAKPCGFFGEELTELNGVMILAQGARRLPVVQEREIMKVTK